jgi:4a-hydroxytetrahydrobiopterin dehydratase
MKAAALPDADVSEWLRANPTWRRAEQMIVKTYECADFATALAFAVRVGCLAEKHDHHPEIRLRWGACEVTWWSHDVKAISSRDLVLAAQCDDAFA